MSSIIDQTRLRKVILVPPDLYERVRDHRFTTRKESDNATFLEIIEAGLKALGVTAANGEG